MSSQVYALIKYHMDKGATFLEALYLVEKEREQKPDSRTNKAS